MKGWVSTMTTLKVLREVLFRFFGVDVDKLTGVKMVAGLMVSTSTSTAVVDIGRKSSSQAAETNDKSFF